MVTGLIAVAVASEKVILHPHAQGSAALSLLLSGGPVIFLAAQGWFLGKVIRARPRLHWIGGVVLLVAGGITLLCPAYLSLLLVGALLATLAILDRHA